MKNKQNKFIIIMYIAITCIFVISLTRAPKQISELENRELFKIEKFSLKNYIYTSFQDNTEKAISDQIIGSETIRKTFQTSLNFSKNLANIRLLCRNSYIKLGEGEGKKYYSFNCDNRIIYGVNTNEKEYESKIRKIENIYDKYISKYDTYFYYIPTSYTFDFRNNREKVSIYNNVKHKWNISYLEYNNYDEYKDYFYATDHHWNHKGSYKGYTDILELLKVNEKAINPEEEITFDFYFYGSEARILQIQDYKEPFKVYRYQIPDHTTWINNEIMEYGKQKEYFNGNYNKDIWTNHYGDFYGMDYAEIVFDFNKKEKMNLLIISNSFSNCINELIASHFNKTFVIDLRYYEDFNIDDYIKNNNISKVLFIMDSENYFSKDSYIIQGGD